MRISTAAARTVHAPSQRGLSPRAPRCRSALPCATRRDGDGRDRARHDDAVRVRRTPSAAPGGAVPRADVRRGRARARVEGPPTRSIDLFPCPSRVNEVVPSPGRPGAEAESLLVPEASTSTRGPRTTGGWSRPDNRSAHSVVRSSLLWAAALGIKSEAPRLRLRRRCQFPRSTTRWSGSIFDRSGSGSQRA